jgi:CheY-like chemotaxis protein
MRQVMGGLEAISAIRAQESSTRRPRVPIIVMSGGVAPEEQEACVKAGADDFLPKPVPRRELLAMLEKHIC